MNNKLLMDNLRCIPDFPVKGVNFRDVTTLFKNGECLQEMIDSPPRRRRNTLPKAWKVTGRNRSGELRKGVWNRHD